MKPPREVIGLLLLAGALGSTQAQPVPDDPQAKRSFETLKKAVPGIVDRFKHKTKWLDYWTTVKVRQMYRTAPATGKLILVLHAEKSKTIKSNHDAIVTIDLHYFDGVWSAASFDAVYLPRSDQDPSTDSRRYSVTKFGLHLLLLAIDDLSGKPEP